MKSIPSLVASSTVGAAATGLVFGRRQQSLPERPSSNKRKASEYEIGGSIVASTPNRPATSATLRTPMQHSEPRSSPTSTLSSRESPLVITDTSTDVTPHTNRLDSYIRRQGSVSAHESGSEGGKDSISSRGSWYRRLSTIPTTHTNSSPRSSVGPDSPSGHLSHGSVAPILSSNSDRQAPASPNKLVKRAFSGRVIGEERPTSGSRSQMPTLRRPATSHQRRATLQQQFREPEQSKLLEPSTPDVDTLVHQTYSKGRSKSYYRHYFEPRNTKLAKEVTDESSPSEHDRILHSVSRRVTLPDDRIAQAPTLLKAEMIIKSIEVDDIVPDFDADNSAVSSTLDESLENAKGSDVRKRSRRSLSMHFSSPTSWISRSGSLSVSKRGEESRMVGKRHASAPLPSMRSRAHTSGGNHDATRADNSDVYARLQEEADASNDVSQESGFNFPESHSPRGSSSPIPALSRLSSFNLDLARLGLSSSSGQETTASLSPLSKSPFLEFQGTKVKAQRRDSTGVIIHQSQTSRFRSTVSDRASTLNTSDSEVKRLAAGEDDDTDFQSESMFDSYRTGNTGSTRVRSPALESMFDDSPVSTSSRSKGVTIDELAANKSYANSHNGIVEEEEGMTTPMKNSRPSIGDTFTTPTKNGMSNIDAIRSSPPSFSLAATQNFGRLSLEDEEDDEDWTKEDDNFPYGSSLSPPSTTSSARLQPAVRIALAAASGNAQPFDDRPKSVFDWSDPSVIEKQDEYGQTPRPRTVHGKQALLDGRGGRGVGRRGPTALHIRSQSVPVVPQLSIDRDSTKMSKKFGTWGLGGKGVSEDWDNDFEFEGIEDEAQTGEMSMTSSVVVPKAIKESQAKVVGHVHQVREMCLAVDDLKRLRALAKEKSLLYGGHASLWREADGIIALAAGDEEDTAFSPPRSPIESTTRHGSIGEHLVGEDTDMAEAEHTLAPASPAYLDRPARFANAENFHNRRRSVFSPDDDIFGVLESVESDDTEDLSLPKYSSSNKSKNSTDVARSVMEDIHQRRMVSDPLDPLYVDELSTKLPFDTTSLKELVNRASSLARILAEVIRKHDVAFRSPNRSPEHRRDDRDHDSSPAFTRVFTPEHIASPPQLPRSQSGNSVLNPPLDNSPTRAIGQRMHMMTVV